MCTVDSKAVDDSIVLRARSGDRDAFQALIDRYSALIHAIVWARLGNAGVSEDICQETFLVAYENLKKLRNPAKFAQWIKRIASNLCGLWIRNEEYSRSLAERIRRHEMARQERNTLPDEEVEHQEVLRLVERGIQGLSVKLRETLLLYYFEGRSAPEVAQALGISHAAVRKRLETARKQLRDFLTAELETSLAAAHPKERLSKHVMLAIPGGSVAGKLGLSAAATGMASGGGTISKLLLSLKKLAPIGGILMSAKQITVGISIAAIIALLFVTLRSAQGPEPEVPPVSAQVEEREAEELASPAGVPIVEPVPVEPVEEETSPLLSLLSLPPDEPVAETRPFVVFGTVKDWKENSVSGADVEIRRIGEDARSFLPRSELESKFTESDSQGKYEVKGLTQGMYSVQAVSENMAALKTSQLRDDLRVQVDLQLSKAMSIAGKVVGPAGEAVADAEVTPIANLMNSRNRPGWTTFGTRSDENGRFETEPVPATSYYSLLAFAKGYGMGTIEEAIPGSRDLVIQLSRSASVSGRVTWKSGGDPVENLEVTVEPDDFDDFPHTGTTDEDGNYQILDLRAGEHHVSVDSSVVPFAKVSFNLTAGQELTGIDIELSDGATISGTVTDESTGDPIPDAEVFCGSKDGDRKRVKTDADGYYIHTNLAEGTHSVSVSRAGIYARSSDGGVPPFSQVEISAGDNIEGIDFTLQKGGMVWGKVIDEEGNPILDAQVRLDPLVYPDLNRGARTKGDGSYRIEGFLAEKEYSLFAMKSGYFPSDRQTIKSNGGMELEANLTLTKTEATDRSISGIVVDSEGRSIQGAIVALRLIYEGSTGLLGSIRDITGKQGEFELAGIINGQHILSAEHPDYSDYRDNVTIREDTAMGGYEIVLKPESFGFVAGRVVYDDGTAVSGEFIYGHQETDASIVNKQVILGDDGRFRLEGYEDAFPVNLGVHHSLSGWHQKTVDPNTEDVLITLPKLSPGTVRGKVLTASGRPINHFRVGHTLRINDPRVLSDVRTFESDSGEFELEDLSPGNITLLAMADGYGPVMTTPISIPSDGIVDGIEIYMERAGSIRGAVKDRDTRQPVANVFVTIEDFNPVIDQQLSSIVLQATTSGNGEFVLEGIPPGFHRLTTWADEYAPALSDPIQVASGAETPPVTILLDRGGSLEGYLNVGGVSLERSYVFVVSTDDSSFYKAEGFDDKGYYRIETIPQGTYRVQAMLRPSMEIGVGRFPITHYMDMVAGDTVQVDFAEEEGGTLNIAVTGPEGSTSASIFLLEPDAPEINPNDFGSFRRYYLVQHSTQPDGTFTVVDIPSGTYKVVAAIQIGHNTYIQESQMVTITAGEETVLVFEDLE